jgi:ribosomal protein S19
MLEYTKTVLEKVSFNRELFKKELQKSKKFLKEEEVELLRNWCRMSFTEKYPDIIGEVFETYKA